MHEDDIRCLQQSTHMANMLTMTKWEYTLQPVNLQSSYDDIGKLLNELGRDGWEFLDFHEVKEHHYALFKKPKLETDGQ